MPIFREFSFKLECHIVGRICNNFEKNRAFYDKSMKLGTWLVGNKTKKNKGQCHAEMPSNGRHLVFSKMTAFFQLIHYNLIIYLQTSCFLQLILLKQPSVISQYLKIIFQFKKKIRIEAVFFKMAATFVTKKCSYIIELYKVINFIANYF